MHLLQKEAAQLKNQYQSNIPPDEMNVRQIQHTQFHISPKAQNNKNHQIELYHPCGSKICDGYLSKAGDLASFSIKGENDLIQLSSPLQKPPLQQQLMQHRLLQQKRQILQKQNALENGLSRRQMLRQQSYKIAQQQQIVPPIPLNEIESEDLHAFQAIVEGQIHEDDEQLSSPKSPSPSMIDPNGSPKIMKTTHIQMQPYDNWNSLSGSMQTCQINENNTLGHDNWMPPYQVYSGK